MTTKTTTTTAATAAALTIGAHAGATVVTGIEAARIIAADHAAGLFTVDELQAAVKANRDPISWAAAYVVIGRAYADGIGDGEAVPRQWGRMVRAAAAAYKGGNVAALWSAIDAADDSEDAWALVEDAAGKARAADRARKSNGTTTGKGTGTTPTTSPAPLTGAQRKAANRTPAAMLADALADVERYRAALAGGHAPSDAEIVALTALVEAAKGAGVTVAGARMAAQAS